MFSKQMFPGPQHSNGTAREPQSNKPPTCLSVPHPWHIIYGDDSLPGADPLFTFLKAVRGNKEKLLESISSVI